MSAVRLTVDTAAITANTRLFAGLAAQLIAVVKADGYGIGAVTLAEAALAGGASRLGTTGVAPAVALRDAGLGAPVLSWLNPPDADFEVAVHADIELAVPNVAVLDAIERAANAARRTAQIHLQLDVGMARDGCPPELWPQLTGLAAAAQQRGRVRVVGVMGHLSSADTPGAAANRRERACFARGVRVARSAGLTPGLVHLAASSATLTQPAARFTASRVGAGLLGIDLTGTRPLSGALSCDAPVMEVRRVPAGTAVGYGHTWVAPHATRLALVGAGYADGVPRCGSGARVFLRGRTHAVVGRVSMDELVVDLGDDPAQPGDTVTLFGPGSLGEPTLDDWAGWCDTIPQEIVARLGARSERRVVADVGLAAAR